MIIPAIVIDGLDYLKKGTGRQNKGARDAIRYLEKQFRTRNRFIRPQQPGESLTRAPLPVDTTPEATALLACARHFAQAEARARSLVTILSSDPGLEVQVGGERGRGDGHVGRWTRVSSGPRQRASL